MSELPVIPQPGDPAPTLKAVTSTGETLDLQEQRGKWVVVYFYPRANTPG